MMRGISDLLYALVKDEDSRYSLGSLFPKVFGDPKAVDKVIRNYKLGLPVASAEIKFEPSKSKDPTRGISASNEDLVAFATFKHLLERARTLYDKKAGIVIFLDEFDQLEDRAKVGLLLKSINNVRFVIIGVAATRKSLVGHHPSVARKLTSYEIPLLSQENVDWFFTSAERKSGGLVAFTKEFRRHVFEKSSGFPWLVQQLGFYSLREATPPGGYIRSGAKVVVDTKDYRAMIGDFIRSTLGGEDLDIGVLKPAERKILLALSESSSGRLSDDDLYEKIPVSLRPHYDEALEVLMEAELVHKHLRQVRITDPLTKILIELAKEENFLGDMILV